MKYFEVGYMVSDSICSFNIISANTGSNEREAALETAERKAAKRGRKVASIREITTAEANTLLRRGYPFYPVDAEAEEKYDPSFH